jgi:hypothetical protein
MARPGSASSSASSGSGGAAASKPAAGTQPAQRRARTPGRSAAVGAGAAAPAVAGEAPLDYKGLLQKYHGCPLTDSGSLRGTAARSPSGRVSPALTAEAGGAAGGAAATHEEGADAAGSPADERVPCASCGRKFAPAAHDVHARVCDKEFGGKRRAAAGATAAGAAAAKT